MKRDYEFFGDLLVFDTTHKTNKYKMICGPFVGMNHHANNVMFGMGFILNERTESFEWLFDTFLRSMDGKSPITIMTDQAQSIANAIHSTFSSFTNHRLCTWHIDQNSLKHIRHLRALDGFVDLFNYLMKYCETPAEFEFYWKRFFFIFKMKEEYNCGEDGWLADLYKIKEMWCPAYSKKYWSGGVLSSQRCETTNKSVKHRLNATQGLCDFYQVFLDVIFDWRGRENNNDFDNIRGNKGLAVGRIGFLEHCRMLYTHEAYSVIQEEFIKGLAHHVENSIADDDPRNGGSEKGYYLWRPGVDLFRHEVAFNKVTLDTCCTCMFFSEMGLFCSHVLRVYHMNNVHKVTNSYILKRWTKAAMCEVVAEDPSSNANTHVLSSSVWRCQTLRNFVKLVTSCQSSIQARAEVDASFNLLKEKIENIIGTINFEKHEEDVDIPFSTINNPPKSRQSGERNLRPKSIVEKAYNRARGNWRRRRVQIATSVRAKGQRAVQQVDEHGVPLSYCNSITDPNNLVVVPDPSNQASKRNCVQPQSEYSNSPTGEVLSDQLHDMDIDQNETTNVELIFPTSEIVNNDQVDNDQAGVPANQFADSVQAHQIQRHPSPSIPTRYDRLLAFFDTSVAKRLTNENN